MATTGTTQNNLSGEPLHEIHFGYESLYESLMEEAFAGVLIIQNSKFVYANPRFVEMVGYSQEELLGMNSSLDIVHPEDRNFVHANIQKRVQGEVKSLHYECRALNREGRILHVEVMGTQV